MADRLVNRVQLTSDGHKSYLNAVRGAFGNSIDYAQVVKRYGHDQDEKWYSPAKCVGCQKFGLIGFPDVDLTLRMVNRRQTQLTNAFSKKLENHEHAIALH